MKNPLISVLMSAYREPLDWIKQSIDSILSQTFNDFEFLIACDDPSNVQVINLLKEYENKDPRIILIFNNQNIGLTKSLNKALRMAKGKYIARMDADDIAYPERFKIQVDYMESHPKIIVLGTHLKLFGSRKGIHFNDSVKYDNKSIKEQMLLENCIPHSSVLIRKSILDDNHIEYDESYRQGQDFRLWEVLYDLGDFEILRETLLMYRFSSQQISQKNKKSQMNNSVSVRNRLQSRWLKKNGYNIEPEEIESTPFKVLSCIKKDKNIKGTGEYNAFVQFLYLIHPEGKKHFAEFIKGDWMCFSFLNFARTLRIFYNAK